LLACCFDSIFVSLHCSHLYIEVVVLFAHQLYKTYDIETAVLFLLAIDILQPKAWDCH